MDNTMLAEEVTGILAAANLRQADLSPTGHPSSPGFTVEPMPFPGQGRVAVTWYDTPGSWEVMFGFGRCWDTLTRAGYPVYRLAGRGHRDYIGVSPARRPVTGGPAYACANTLCGYTSSSGGYHCGQPMTALR